MNRFLTTLAFTVLLPVVTLAQPINQLEKLKEEIESDLIENILPFWINHAVDSINGGFYGEVSSDGTPVLGANKGAILGSRILWTFSTAYRIYGDSIYRSMADRAANYYITHFIDNLYGGVYWSVTPNGEPKDVTKQTYATAFGIYGLAEHFRATGNERSLNSAISLYRTLEDKVHQKQEGGYIEVFGRDYTRSGAKGVDGNASATKTMNTHIHILEAYTTLYKVWPNRELKSNLVELLDILAKKLYNAQTGHLILFCNDNWKPLEDEVSYGHDIETSWLICEAAEAIGDEAIISATQKQALSMVNATLENGFEANWLMKSESKGYQKLYHWWPQSEAIVGLINAWQITGNREYLDAAVKCWATTSRYFVDRENGGWHKTIKDDFSPLSTPKASEWNCPYHNSRMGFEISSRITAP